MSQHLELSLIIPCYNEAENLPALIRRCREVFAGRAVEIILVDNGSSDGSDVILASHLTGQDQIRSVRIDHNKGFGFGVMTGLRAAHAPLLAWTHADLQTDPADVVRGMHFFREANTEARLFVKGRRYGRKPDDVLFTIAMALFETVLLRRFFWDINAQPTMFPRALLDLWDHPPDDFALELYAYYMAQKHGFAVKRFPVHFGPRLHGSSKWNFNGQAKWKMIKRTVSFSLALQRHIC